MERRIDKSEIIIPDSIKERWQRIADLMVAVFETTTGFVTRIDLPWIEAVAASRSPGNPFRSGDKVKIAGHYCEMVMAMGEPLSVQDARRDACWRASPEQQHGLIAYLGYPLFWPDGEIFGTICVHDTRENAFSERTRNLMLEFRYIVEAHLGLVYVEHVFAYRNNRLAMRNEIGDRQRIPASIRCVECGAMRSAVGEWQAIGADDEPAPDSARGICTACLRGIEPRFNRESAPSSAG